jgi:hypothetical protein
METGEKLRTGENLIHSPLRKDRNPSFSINTNTGLWHDFGTLKGGDTISFVMQKYGVSFAEAKNRIEYQYGKLPNEGTRPKVNGIERQARQGTKEEYCFLEVVKNGIYNRGTFEQLATIPEYNQLPGSNDCFHSMYWHSVEIVSFYKRQGDLKGYFGAVWSREMVFDIDHKGDTIEERVSKALHGLKNLIHQALKIYGLSFCVKFSGNKGFHISFSSPALDKISGYINTPVRVELLARKMARGIEGIDFSIYSSATRLIRSENSINTKSGLYAIPLTEAEIYSFSPAQIIELAKKPRRIVSYPVKAYSSLIGESFTINADGSAIFQNGVSFTKNEIGKLRNERDKDAIKKIFLLKKTFQGEIL